MDDLQKVLFDIVVVGGKAVAESSVADGAKLLYAKLKELLRGRHGLDAVTALGTRHPSAEVLARLEQQLKSKPAVLESPEVRSLMLDLMDAVPALVDLDNVQAARKVLIRNVEGGGVRIRNSTAGDDLTIEGVTRTHSSGKAVGQPQ